MARTARAILEKALGFVGTKEDPAGSNNVIFNTAYYGHAVQDGVPKGASYPWCCVFVWYIFYVCGASGLFFDGKKTAYCPAVESWGRGAGLAVATKDARPGDIVLFDWNHNGVADHIGFIVENLGGGKFTTVEGNTSQTSNDNGGCVMRRVRNASDICCVIRPQYESEEEIDMSREELERLIDERAEEIAERKVREAVGKFVERIGELPSKALEPEVRELLDCGAINGGTPYETDPDDIRMPYQILRAVVMAKRYADFKVRQMLEG